MTTRLNTSAFRGSSSWRQNHRNQKRRLSLETLESRCVLAPMIIDSAILNDGAGPRGDLTNVAFRFNEDVETSLDVSDIRLTRFHTKSSVPLNSVSVQWESATDTAVFDLSNEPIACGLYELSLNSHGINNASGESLDGDSNGTAGGDFEETILVALAGDTDFDGEIDSGDLIRLLSAGTFQNNDAVASWSTGDFNGDGQFTTQDIIAILLHGRYATGDYSSYCEPRVELEFNGTNQLANNGFFEMDDLTQSVSVSLPPQMEGINTVSVLLNGEDISSEFDSLPANHTDTQTLTLPLGQNRIDVLVNNQELMSATMLNFTPSTLNIPPDVDASDTILDPVTNQTAHDSALALSFHDGTTDEEIADFLRENQLTPLGTIFDRTHADRPTVVYAEAAGGDVFDLSNDLSGQAPLALAMPVFTATPRTIAGERMPARLVAGAAPNAGQGYNAATGGFDDNGNVTMFDGDGDGALDEDGYDRRNNDGDTVGGMSFSDEDPLDPADELNFAWHHFFTDTFPALRLRDQVIGRNRAVSVVAITDSGFGNGGANVAANPALADIAGRINPLVLDFRGAAGAGVNEDGDGATDEDGFDGIDNDGDGRIDEDSRFHAAITNVTDTADHGTAVAAHAGGNGTRIFGAGPDQQLLIARINFLTPGVNLQSVATIPQVDVINASWGSNNNLPLVNVGAAANAAGMTQAMAQARANNKIVVIAASETVGNNVAGYWPDNFTPQRGQRSLAPGGLANGIDNDNQGGVDEDRWDGVDNDGDGRIDEDAPDNRLTMLVTATNITNESTGPESAANFNNVGNLVSVSAAGGDYNIGIAPNATTHIQPGTSFAAPKVAGLLGEMIEIRDVMAGGRRAAANHPTLLPQLQMVETVEATVDDLGNSGAATALVWAPCNPLNLAQCDQVNDRPDLRQGNANSPDNAFGWGRINAWKAILSVANQGLAMEGRTDTTPRDGMDDTFRSLNLVANPTWYGFEIRTSVRGATVWIGNNQLTDAGMPGPVPGTPNITAYAGVKPSFSQQNNPARTTNGMDLGTVPIGNNGGEFITKFSVTRDELVNNDGSARVLSLRMPGQTVNDAPYFNLELDLTRMRQNRVPGVTYDDFVFEITPPDFGDAPTNANYPTTLAQNGGRHLNTNLEWFGRTDPSTQVAASPEHDAVNVNNRTTDPDGIPNVVVEDGTVKPDLDRYDDGILFYPLTYTPNNRGRVDFTVCTADARSGRYANDVDRSLYVNGWFDWNESGSWEEGSEHPIDGVRLDPSSVDPMNGVFNWTIRGSRNASTTVTQTSFTDVGRCGIFRADFDVPQNIPSGDLWSRFRLDYGEDVGRNNPTPLFASDSTLRAGAALAANAAANSNTISVTSNVAQGSTILIGSGANQEQKTVTGVAGAGPFTLTLDSMLANTHNVPQNIAIASMDAGAAQFGEIEDYVVDIDVGDAPDPFTAPGFYPTELQHNGPIHLETHREWLGTSNLVDDGLILPDVFFPNSKEDIQIRIQSSIDPRGFTATANYTTRPANCGARTVTVADAQKTPLASRDKGRYDPSDSEKRLFINVWADWNGDGNWTDSELVVSGPVDPSNFGGDGQYTLGEPFVDANFDGVYTNGEAFTDIAGVNSLLMTCSIDVPDEVAPNFYFRARLSYGESLARDVDVVHHSTYSRALAKEKGSAFWGEVEDWPAVGIPHLSYPEFEAPYQQEFTTGVVDSAIIPGNGPYTYSLVEETVVMDGMENTPLPPGLSIDEVTGEIFGLSELPGVYWPLVLASEIRGEETVPKALLWYHIHTPPPHVEVVIELPPGMEFSTGPYDTSELPGDGPYEFHVVEEAPLPPGLEIDHITGEIAGAIAMSGDFMTAVIVEELRPDGPVPVTEIWYQFVTELEHIAISETVPLDAPFGISLDLFPGISEIVLEPAGTVSHGMTSTDLPPGMEFDPGFRQVLGIAEELGTFRPLFTVFALIDGEMRPVAQIWLELNVVVLSPG